MIRQKQVLSAFERRTRSVLEKFLNNDDLKDEELKLKLELRFGENQLS